MDPKDLVRQGYERIAESYDKWTERVDASSSTRFLEILPNVLDPGARVLELGCGTGRVTERLVERYTVAGADFSGASLRLAALRTPSAAYIQADMTRLGIRAASLDAVLAFYSLIHVPRGDYGSLLETIAAWLRPAGIFGATFGLGDSPELSDDDWLGVPMFWSSYGQDVTLSLIEQAGMDVLRADPVSQEEDGLDVTFLWVIARKRPA